VGVQTPNTLSLSLTGHTDTVNSVTFSPTATVLASSSDDKTIRLWDPKTGHLLAPPLTGHTEAVYGIAFSNDGAMLASASADSTIRLWDGKTGLPIGPPLRGHTAEVLGVMFSRDGTSLVSSSSDGTIRLWDVASGVSVGSLDAFVRDDYYGIALTPDEATLAIVGYGGIRVWDFNVASWKLLACQMANRNLTHQE
jgi:WD40 repeat protein